MLLLLSVGMLRLSILILFGPLLCCNAYSVFGALVVQLTCVCLFLYDDGWAADAGLKSGGAGGWTSFAGSKKANQV